MPTPPGQVSLTADFLIDPYVGTLVRRLPDLALAVPADTLVYKPSVLVRGLESLPVRFTPVG